MNRYEVVSIVGEGAYGVVLKCLNRVCGGAIDFRPRNGLTASVAAALNDRRTRKRLLQ